ncbi:MAG TPA: alpha/beta fold hydrolase [Hyphomonadaceae bacterium]|nr:alpha/beta fold hydrolase [Hyphomonadaceae bacterium]HPI47030.1 alpha/beta fold hydrolase [Hyphomonadaceae bacterium]
MDATILIWLMGGLAALLVMMIIVVSIARGMDAGRPAIKTSLPGHLAQSLGLASEETKAITDGDDETTKQKKQMAAFFSIAATVAAVIGVISFAKGFNDGDIMPAISELTAGELRGTLVNVRNSDPVVLIVPGSGPTDRDGNSPLGLKTDAYKLLADALAEEGIATVRVDKRGMFGSANAGDPNAVTPASYVADYHAWIDAIKAERGSDCVWLLGHSEGALMVSLAAENRRDVCGLILVAGMGRKMGDVIRQQLRANPANAPILDEALEALSQLEAGRHVDTTNMTPSLLSLFAPQVQDYLISILNVDPVEAVRRANKPTLVVQGTTDLQVTVEDAKLLNKARRTTLKLIDGMNHILKEAPIDRATNLATYADPSLPLAPKLVSRITDFIDDND